MIFCEHAANLAVRQMVQSLDRRTSRRPMLILAERGCGGTHALRWSHQFLTASAWTGIFSHAQEFRHEMIDSIRSGTNKEFRERYLAADFVCIDGLHQLKNMVRTLAELCILSIWRANPPLLLCNYPVYHFTEHPNEEVEPSELMEQFLSHCDYVELERPDDELLSACVIANVKAAGNTITDFHNGLIVGRSAGSFSKTRQLVEYYVRTSRPPCSA